MEKLEKICRENKGNPKAVLDKTNAYQIRTKRFKVKVNGTVKLCQGLILNYFSEFDICPWPVRGIIPSNEWSIALGPELFTPHLLTSDNVEEVANYRFELAIFRRYGGNLVWKFKSKEKRDLIKDYATEINSLICLVKREY